jgi:hypothetical protein
MAAIAMLSLHFPMKNFRWLRVSTIFRDCLALRGYNRGLLQYPMILTRWSPIGVDIATSFLSGIAALQRIVNPQTKALKRGRGPRRLILAAPWFLICACGMAQQSPSQPTPDASSQSQESQTTAKPANPIQSGVVLFKLLQQQSLVFPDLATSEGPLSSWQKFKLATNNSVALSTIGQALIASAYDQAVNRPSGYHQGWEGYGKRFGADMARSASDNLFGTFLLASALHQDPRFFVKRNLSFGQSVKYAAVRVLYTSTDAGEKQINYSGLIGPLLSEGLANAYYPEQNRTAGSTLTRYAYDLSWRFAGNLLRQYWPTINRRLRLAPEPSSTGANP